MNIHFASMIQCFEIDGCLIFFLCKKYEISIHNEPHYVKICRT